MANDDRLFDVFLSYNSEDRSDVAELNRLLRGELGFQTWFDDDQILPGDPFIERLDEGIRRSRLAVVFVGKSGLGPWEKREVYSALSSQVEDSAFRVIPVLLPTASSQPKLPFFLASNRWVDLRGHLFEGLRQLVSALRAAAPVSVAPAPLVLRASDTPLSDALPSSFSTDVESVVNLLIGESLYSRKDVFVRELLQNAVDACERRRQDVLGYVPDIIVRIDARAGWFEVEDNGEGMNSVLLRERFAVIGRSIRHEEKILLRTIASERDRLYLIAKFGIGFITTFLVADKVSISTRFEDSAPIHFEISGIRKPFQYLDDSTVTWKDNRIGTVIRVYLNESFRSGGEHSIDLLEAVTTYVRHCSYVRIYDDGSPVVREEEWGTEDCKYTQRVRVGQKFDASVGVSESTGELIASNAGFLVTENPENILPYSLPLWIVGEVNFWPGVVDLNLARNAIVANSKALAVKQELTTVFQTVILEYIRTRIRAVGGAPKDRLSPADDQIRKYLLYCLTKETSVVEPALLGPTVAAGLYCSLMYTPFGPERSPTSVADCIATLVRDGVEVAYTYFRHHAHSAIAVIVQRLRATSNLVLEYSYPDVPLYGRKGGSLRFSEKDAYKQLLQQKGISLVVLDDTRPEEIEGLATNPSSIPELLRREAKAARTEGKLAFVQIPGGDLSFRVGSTLYVNTANASFEQFARSLRAYAPEVIKAYFLGMTQRDIGDLYRAAP